MNYLVEAPSAPQALIRLPASKSISNRALILNALCRHPYPIENLSDCDDTRVLDKALHAAESIIDIGAAGTSMRFLTALLSQTPGERILTGSERMKQRPIKLLVEALRQTGAQIQYQEKEGFPPLRIQGRRLQGGNVTLDGSISSQYISALLLIAPCMKNGLTLTLTGKITSEPYINMTLGLMKTYGVSVQRTGNTLYVAPQKYTSVPFRVESDWSAASYWYEIAALSGSGRLILTGLKEKSLQGDSKTAYLFRQLGVGTRYQGDTVELYSYPSSGEKFVCDLSDQPDLAQTLAITCAFKAIPFHLSGLHTLKIKETDRLYALQTELGKLGFQVRIIGDAELQWQGERRTADSAPLIRTYDDHRMAMAFAPIALKKPGGIRIDCPEVVTKSYPAFWEDLKKAGLHITPQENS